ncbi:hypothetical protein F4554_001218 [Actinopolymorpha rutila]|uniref:Tyr recombinase domain-containing protein n=1 Tax=Actinopolymorpha rutila TaxID=446787 RepID=A0A852ZHM9_9ACTN|nr:hypothetical protein [Actinopolymorpha rutila]
MHSAAGCSQPVRLAGMVRTTNVNTRTGEVTETKTVTEDMPDGVIYKACGNRRASVCPSCAEIYRADAYQLVLAGMRGGKGVPETVSGGPLRVGNFRQRMWTPAVKAAGLQGFTIHGLRHTAASLYISACTPPKVVQRVLGHASVVMTMDLYGHLYPDEMDTWAARLNEVAGQSGVWPERGQNDGSETTKAEVGR